MSSLNGIPPLSKPNLSGLTSVKADAFTLGNVTISANSISGIDTIAFNNFTVSSSAIFNCPTTIYGNLTVSKSIINPDLSNSNTTVFNQLGNLTTGNVSAHTQILALQNSNVNLQLGNSSAHTQILALQNANTNIQLGNSSAHNKILDLQNANVNLQLGNSSAHGKILDLQNANVNIQLGNITAHGKILDLQNANVNIQLGNLSSHTRVTTLETKTQLLSSNALVSVFSGNLAVRSNISLEKYINSSCNIYSTSTPQLNFYGDGGTGQEYYGTISFLDGTGASKATISSSLVSGNLSLSYGAVMSGIRIRKQGTDLLTCNEANTSVTGNLTVAGNIFGYSTQNYLTGNIYIGGNVGIGTTNPIGNLHVLGHSRLLGNLNTTGLYVTASGNVGIGTNTTSANLHVLGNALYANGNVGIGTTVAVANLHIENSKVYLDANKNVLINPASGFIYCYNNNNSDTSAHSSMCLRVAGSGGGNPHISLDINGVQGWSIFQDNADSDCLKIKAGWDMPSSSTYDCLKIGTDRKFFIYGEPSIRCRYHAIGSYAGSYTAGQNINFSYTVQDISGSSSNSSGVLTLPNYAGYYTVTCNGRFTDGNSTNGMYLYAGATNLFGTSDGVFWGTTDPANRRCWSYSITRYLGASNQIRAQMYAGTTFDLVLISVVYHGIQN